MFNLLFHLKPIKTPCPYCHGNTVDDVRGNCSACGGSKAIEETTSEEDKYLIDQRKRKIAKYVHKKTVSPS